MSWWDGAVGRSAELNRTFSREDLAAYSLLVDEPIHSGQVPEPLIAGLFSTLLGVHLPGAGTNYLKQSMKFLLPADIAQPLRAIVEIISVRPDKRLVRLSTTCTTAYGAAICHGEALVLAAGVPMAAPNDED